MSKYSIENKNAHISLLRLVKTELKKFKLKHVLALSEPLEINASMLALS